MFRFFTIQFVSYRILALFCISLDETLFLIQCECFLSSHYLIYEIWSIISHDVSLSSYSLDRDTDTMRDRDHILFHFQSSSIIFLIEWSETKVKRRSYHKWRSKRFFFSRVFVHFFEDNTCGKFLRFINLFNSLMLSFSLCILRSFDWANFLKYVYTFDHFFL